jgi:hypothetical protein
VWEIIEYVPNPSAVLECTFPANRPERTPGKLCRMYCTLR